MTEFISMPEPQKKRNTAGPCANGDHVDLATNLAFRYADATTFVTRGTDLS